MPVSQGAKGRNMGATNKDLRTEIQEQIISQIGNVADVMRDHDSIYTSPNFHLDSKSIGVNYKVEIQYKKGTKQTVSEILLSNAASNVADVREGLTQSLKDGYIYKVT